MSPIGCQYKCIRNKRNRLREHTFHEIPTLPPLHVLKIPKGILCLLRCLIFWTSESRVYQSFRPINLPTSKAREPLQPSFDISYRGFSCDRKGLCGSSKFIGTYLPYIPGPFTLKTRYLIKWNILFFRTLTRGQAFHWSCWQTGVRAQSVIRKLFPVAGTISEGTGVHSRSTAQGYSQDFPSSRYMVRGMLSVHCQCPDSGNWWRSLLCGLQSRSIIHLSLIILHGPSLHFTGLRHNCCCVGLFHI